MSNDLTKLSLRELRAGLDAGDFSARELTQHYINRNQAAKDLNVNISEYFEQGLEQAEAAQSLIKAGSSKTLTGIPLSIKDIILVKGQRTTAGSRFLENFIAPYNSTVAARIADAGGIIIAKNNQDEFAMGSSNENSYYGPVANPWNKEHVPGGSSGGSAAAVAAGLTPGTFGTDTGGSIRQPSAFCGVHGIKPTYGRVSRYGVVAFASSLDQVGPMANSVEDLATLLQVVSGHDPLDSTCMTETTPDFTANLGQDIKGLRVGIPAEYFADGLDDEVADAVNCAIKKLTELGAEVVQISLPNTAAAVACYYILAPAEASSNLSRYDGIRYGRRASGKMDLQELYSKSRSEGFGLEVKRRILTGTYVLSSGYYDAYYLKAQRVRAFIKQDFVNAFADKCDLIAAPVTPTTAFKLGENQDDPVKMYLNDIFTIPVNLAGLPALSTPCGYDKQGLPIGLQLIGNYWQEALLLQVAAAYQAATDWQSKRDQIL